MKAFPLTQPYVKVRLTNVIAQLAGAPLRRAARPERTIQRGVLVSLCTDPRSAAPSVAQVHSHCEEDTDIFSATHEERDALLAAYVPEDQSEPTPLYNALATDTAVATGEPPKEGAPAAADDTDDVYLDMNEDAAPDYHARTPPSRTWSAAEKLADLATHASYAVLSRGSTWDELRLDDVGPALYASLAKHSHASASLHWLGVLTERLLECPQSVPALLPSVTAVLQMVL